METPHEVIAMMGLYGHGLGWGSMAVGWTMMLVFGACGRRYRRVGAGGDQLGRVQRVDLGPTPLEILKRRYAAGELTKAQFEEMKKDSRNKVRDIIVASRRTGLRTQDRDLTGSALSCNGFS